MNKGLEALEMMDMTVDIILSDEYHEAEKIVEKELKALEIIKEKRVDVDCLIDCFQYDGFVHTTGLIEYNHSTTKTQKELDQEEYDSLKEVLS